MAGQNRSNEYLRGCYDTCGALVAMPHRVHLGHSGRLFFVSRVDSGTGERAYRFKVGDNALHIMLHLRAGLKTAALIIESPTITAEGDAVVVMNYNRIFPDDALETKVYSGSTYTGGSEFRTTQAGFGSAPGNANSGDVHQDAEYIFKPNTEYVVSVTPSASADTVLIADMYEVG